MPFTLPKRFNVSRRILVRSHQHRVVIWFAIMIPFLVVGVVFDKLHVSLLLFWGFVILTLLVGVFGMAYVIRLDKRQCVALGLGCPLCGGALLNRNGFNWLLIRGECPCCKQSIIDKLSE